MVTTLEVGKTDRPTLLAEYDRLSAAGVDMYDAYRVEYHGAGFVKVFRYDRRDGRLYVDPDTGNASRAEPTWHRVTS